MKLIVAAVLVGLLGACASHPPSGPAAPRTAQATAHPINQTCPILHASVDPDITVNYKGRLVGFCCSECIDDWARMGDDLKDRRLRDSM